MKAKLGAYPHDRQVLHEILPLDTPLAVDIHTTHHCNFRCKYCIVSQSDADFARCGLKREAMSWETFSLIVQQLTQFPSKIKMITTGGIGESTTHPKIIDMVRALHEAQVTEKIQMITNAFLLTPKFGENLVAAGLGELRVSLQGLSGEKYFQIAGRQIDWERFYENIRYFSTIKGDCELKVKIADTALEPGDEERFYDLFGDICDAVAVEHIYDEWAVNGADLDYGILPSQKTRYGRPYREVAVCRRLFTSIDILPDGMVTQFCHVCFGHEKNVWERPLLEHWNSLGQNQLRYDSLHGMRYKNPYCKICSVITNTWHPEDLLEGHEEEILQRMREKGMLDGVVEGEKA